MPRPGNTLSETASFGSVGIVDPRDRTRGSSDRGEPRSDSSAPGPAPWIAHALEGGADDSDVALIELRPGDAVPGTRYVIEGWLGDGGMGVVYEARHVDLDRRVALKVLRPEFCLKPSIMQQFRDEARIVSRIGSEHIAEVHDFAELPDGRLLFVMELLRGGTVARELLGGPMEPARMIGIMRQVCKALAAAHAVKVVHRDLKPDNIALDLRHGRRDFVKVLDFGIAVVMSEADVATHLAAGTPSYLAPEVIMGHRLDAGVDVYSAGCTAYEMLSGHPPFRGDSVDAVLRAHLEDPPKALRLVRPELPPGLCNVVMRCLAKSPAARYPSMIELEAALCEAQIEAKLQTSWDDLPVPEIDPERRIALLRRMPDAQGRPTASTSRRWWPAIVAVLVLVAGIALWKMRPRDDDEATRGPIEALSRAAYEAAAGSYFVYPPPDAPHQATAFGVVVELEARAEDLGDAATEEANRLRREFAATLVRLGDDYWERDGGMPFAIDYYAEALIFVPDDAHAASRALLTPGQLALMREKAKTRSFSEAELIAAEPLIALADPDPAKRSEKVAALRGNRRTRSATTEDSLARLSEDAVAPPRAKRPVRAEPVVAEPPPIAPPVAVVPPPVEAAPVVEPTTVVQSAEVEAKVVVRDPAAAEALVDQGNRARDQGRLADARRSFERALVLDRRSHGALIGLSDVAFHGGDYVRAATLARKAVGLAPRNAGYRIRLGDAYFKAFRYDDARTEYVEAQKLGNTAATTRIAKVDAKLK